MSLLQYHGHWACVCLKKKRDRGIRHQQQHIEKQTYVCDKDNSDQDEHFVLDSIETAQIAKIESRKEANLKHSQTYR